MNYNMEKDAFINPKYTPDEIRGMILGLDTLVELEDGGIVPAINLDNAATTPPFKKVAEEVQLQLMYYGSIGRGNGQKSVHSSKVYTVGREIVKDFVGAKDNKYSVIYVNCTTDGMNKLASALIESPEDIVLTTRMEHHANDLPWRMRAKTVYAETDAKGRLDIDSLELLLREYRGRIKYVSVTAASNVTGYVNDVHRIAKIAHNYGAQIIVDGAQIVAHRAFNMLGDTRDEDIDYFVFSAHKMYSPYGGGAVVGLTEIFEKQVPVFYGGGMVDAVYDSSVFWTSPPDLYEAGSPNYPGVVGMLKAMKILKDIGFDYIKEHEQQLLRYTLSALKKIPGVILYGDNDKFDDRVGIIVFNLEGIPNANVAIGLAGHSAIAVRHAAFCAHPYVRRLTNEKPYDVPKDSKDFGHPEGMVRASFGIYNSEKDADTLINTVKFLLENRKTMSFNNETAVFMSARGVTRPNDRG